MGAWGGGRTACSAFCWKWTKRMVVAAKRDVAPRVSLEVRDMAVGSSSRSVWRPLVVEVGGRARRRELLRRWRGLTAPLQWWGQALRPRYTRLWCAPLRLRMYLPPASTRLLHYLTNEPPSSVVNAAPHDAPPIPSPILDRQPPPPRAPAHRNALTSAQHGPSTVRPRPAEEIANGDAVGPELGGHPDAPRRASAPAPASPGPPTQLDG